MLPKQTNWSEAHIIYEGDQYKFVKQTTKAKRLKAVMLEARE
jgi:hypothetical protein